MVISPQYEISFVISEVISDKQEHNCPWMLVEVISLALIASEIYLSEKVFRSGYLC